MYVCLYVYMYLFIYLFIYWYYSMPHYIVILHALHYLSISFTINFTFKKYKKTTVKIHYNVNNNVFDF